jgi:(p)ppGpp synthase/HD superfamily hydrolase
VSGQRFVDALGFATEVHDGQLRKGTAIPYVAHLLAVSALVLEAGGSQDEAIAALFHDALEDQAERVTAADLEARYGPEVARIVVACSDHLGPGPKRPWRERKERHLAKLRHADGSILLVSLADKLHNATTLRRDLEASGPRAWERFKAGPDEQLWYHQSLVAIFRERLPGPMTEEYAATVAAIETIFASGDPPRG